jgi:hypothetical protein
MGANKPVGGADRHNAERPMKRHKRYETLTEAQKAQFTEAAQRFKRDMIPLLASLKAFGDGYRAIYDISQVIDSAYTQLDIEKPDRW